MITAAAILSAGIHAAIAIFQIFLVSGAPWGEYAFGGQHRGVLPKKYRITSVIATGVLLFFAAVNLHQAGMIRLPELGIPLRTLVWIMTGYAVIGTLMNAVSRSRKERLLWTPVAGLLAVLNLFLLYTS